MQLGAATVERRRALDRERVDAGRLARTVRRLDGLDLAAPCAMRGVLVAVAWWFHNEIQDRGRSARWAGDEPPAT